MILNKYTAYSVISQTENKNNNELQKILSLIDSVSQIKTIEKAKEFVKQNFQIQDDIQKFSLGADSFLDIKENSKKYTIRFSYTQNNENQCISFSYNK